MNPRSLVLAVVVALVTVGACSDDGIDRDDAVAHVVDEGGGRISREQAECYVDRMLDELGPGPLRPGAEIKPEQTAKLTTVRVDCIGVANLGGGTGPTAPVELPEGGLPGPKRRGDSTELDALWDLCAAGFGQACDDLFARAVMGSEYEDFGATCGGRTRELQCSAVYPEPGVVLPSGAQPTTTPPPASP